VAAPRLAPQCILALRREGERTALRVPLAGTGCAELAGAASKRPECWSISASVGLKVAKWRALLGNDDSQEDSRREARNDRLPSTVAGTVLPFIAAGKLL